MFHRLITWIVLAWGISCLSADSFQLALNTLQQRCFTCHGTNGKTKGDLDLTLLKSEQAFIEHPEVLEQLKDVLVFNEMPPEDESPLTSTERFLLLDYFKLLLTKTSEHPPDPVHEASLRRLNRFQYNNAVVDLFDLRCVVFSLPEQMMREHQNYFKPETGKMPDKVTVGSRPLGKSQMIEKRLAGVAPFPQDLRAENGFDNRVDHLSLSPLLLESFLGLAQSIVESDDFNQENVGIWDVFFASPKDDANLPEVVQDRLRSFLTRAFRQPPETHTLERYTGYVLDLLNQGYPFTDSMKAVASMALSSPRFLYLFDRPPQINIATKSNDYDLAARLSFFLWGSIPDQHLIKLAAEGKLSDPATLDAEFRRMMHDQRLKRFCDSFPSQWLQLERIISSAPNPDKFPDFYYLKYRDSMHMMMEPLLLFETILIENLPITQLIDSDFTYRSLLLQEAYGSLAIGKLPENIPSEVTVLNFHRLPVTDRRMGGVITTAATMTMTSSPDRSKPITRGAWLTTVLFNKPPEPPPADVPPLTEQPGQGEENMTLRERLAQHRERSDCKGCHEKIDPLGFALENYDAIGNWRSHYENGREVDVSGKLFRQHAFTNPVEFKDALLAEKDLFTRGLAGHLLSFALSRALTPSDQEALDEIVAATKRDGYRIQTLIKSIILSQPFLKHSETQSTH